MIGFTTIQEGQQVLVWNDQGQARVVDRPRNTEKVVRIDAALAPKLHLYEG